MGSKNYINSSKTLSKSICLITPSHVSLNPRLVKEADALSEAGFNVTVFACDFLDWAKKLDKSILDKTNWDYKIITWDKNTSFSLFWLSRIRQHICKKILIFLFYLGPSRYYKKLLFRAYDRVLPEFQDLVNRYKADLYIAHNLQSLPIAVDCALNHNAKVGFDAEDFHSGMFNNKGFQSLEQKITNYYEEVYMPKCDYITASSQGIANAYVNKYCIHKPVTILNVFPLSHRPQKINFYNKCEVLTLYWFSQTIGADRGLEDVINAMSIIRNCRIVLHLRGNWQSGYKEKLFKFAQIKHVPHDRIICHKPESPDKMLDLASEYDIGLALEQPISTNRNICLTNKIFTYLLAGNAIIATNTDGQRKIMDDIGGAGFSYEQGDIDVLAKGLKYWYENRSELNKARRKSWEWGENKYNWDIEKRKYLKIIHDLFVD